MKLACRSIVVLAAVLLGVCSWVPRVSAHPMGNFSINQYTAIRVVGDTVELVYLLDMAEIPTFQELSQLQASTRVDGLASDPARWLSGAVRHSYLADESRNLAANLHLSLDGSALPLKLRATDLLFPPGAGGLPTERLYLTLDARLSGAGRHVLQYADRNFPDRAGWKEIVAGTAGAQLLETTAGTQDRSRALTVYPAHATSSPPQDLSATIAVIPGRHDPASASGAWSGAALRAAQAGVVLSPGSAAAASGTNTWLQQRVDGLTTLAATRELTFQVLVLALLTAFCLGAVHALSPGHGKTMVAAYLVGSKGTTRHAILLGVTVTVTHTAGVFALGLITLFASRYIVPDRLYPWLGAVSGVLISGMGLTLFLHRLAAWRTSVRDTRREAPSTAGSRNEESRHVPSHA